MSDVEERAERALRFSKIWWKSRSDAGKSQEYMSLSLGVSKKTIQNWEKGISSPDFFQTTEWFRVLGLNPFHYYLEFLYPWIFSSDEKDDEEIEKALLELIRNSSHMEKKQLLYLMSGDHGSSWYSLLQMFTAHCHTSMQSRVSAARIITENYEMEEKTGKLVCPDDVRPDLIMLNESINQGKQAALEAKKGYTVQ